MLWRRKAIPWPELPFDEVKKRARLLVIDDSSFIYLDLFKADGYAIDQWSDVTDLSRLERGEFEVILLDVQGVGKAISPSEQGLGILRHLRTINPGQVIIAFSNSEFSLKYHDFFSLADATLSKSADYVDFKRKVDELLKARFSLGFFVTRIVGLANPTVPDRPRFEKETAAAILSQEPGKLRRFFSEKLVSKENIELAVSLAKGAIEIVNECHK